MQSTLRRFFSTEFRVPMTGGLYNSRRVRAVQDPQSYWLNEAKKLSWHAEPTAVTSDGVHYRFRDGSLNLYHNCLERHCNVGRANNVAFKCYSSYTDELFQRNVTYGQLNSETRRLASHLQAQRGLQSGQRVLIYLPTIPEAASAILACQALGAVPVVVFGGFASAEVAKRIIDTEPVLAITASSGQEPGRIVPYKPLLDAAVDLARREKKTVNELGSIVVQRNFGPVADLGPTDSLWSDVVAAAADTLSVHAVSPNHPATIQHTSGTTARPKGLVRPTGAFVALPHAMELCYGVGQSDTMAAISDIGWVVGLNFSILAPLLVGASSVLFEGKPTVTNNQPDPHTLWKIVKHSEAKTLFTSPTAMRSVRSLDPDAVALRSEMPFPHLSNIFLAGERSDSSLMNFLKHHAGIRVEDTYWQTESGSNMLCTDLFDDGGGGAVPPETPAGSAGFPVPGWDLRVVSPTTGLEQPDGELGALVARLPLPLGSATSIYGDDTGAADRSSRYGSSYLQRIPGGGYFDTGDEALRDKDGYFYVNSRADDVIQVSAHRIGTSGIEEAVSALPFVMECAVVGARDQLKGQIPVCFCVKRAGVVDEGEQALAQQVKQTVRSDIGAFASVHRVFFVDALPKTRSGKVLRRCLRAIVDGDQYEVPATIENDQVLTDIEKKVQSET